MKIPHDLRPIGRLGLIQLALLFTIQSIHAGSATWSLNPVDTNWNKAANWTPNTVPNGISDTATFDQSDLPSVVIPSLTNITVNGIVFNPSASQFTITIPLPQFLIVTGVGITNNSGLTQNFMMTEGGGVIRFTGSAAAGSLTSLWPAARA